MAQRDDISVRFDLSPRLIKIAAPSTEIDIQSLHDTLREIEQRPQNLIYPILIETAGKEDLGAGVFVGLTATLQNAQISFEARYDNIANGDVTSGGSSTILTDSSATFLTDGYVERGATITNFNDESYATVIRIISETQIEHENLTDGIINTWTSGDRYKIHNEITANISGGNLVALDEVELPINPVSPSSFVQIVRTSASSATDRNSQDIEHSSFSGGITLDTSSFFSGIDFPVGTPRQPVNNLSDALTIAAVRGFTTIYLNNSVTISGLNVSGIIFVGRSSTNTLVTIDASANVEGCEFSSMDISGTFDGQVNIENANVGNISMVSGSLKNCGLRGAIVLAGGTLISLVDCYDILAGFGTPTLNFNGVNIEAIIRGIRGGLVIINKTGTGDISIDMDSARVVLESTVTTGNVIVRGVGHLTNNSTATVDSTNVVNPGTVSSATLGKLIPFLPS